MRPLDCEAEVKAIMVQLDSETLLSRLREFEKGGLPAASMSDGRGSAESPCPVSEHPKTGVLGPADPVDRKVRADRLVYEQALRNLLTAARTALGITNEYLIARSTDAVKSEKLAAPKGAGVCGNTWCDHVCEGFRENDRLRKAPKRSGDDPAKSEIARCQACDQHWRRHGVERDARVRVAKVKKAGLEPDKVRARAFVKAHRQATPFVASCASALDADSSWLPSADQAKLLLEIETRVTDAGYTKEAV